MEYLSVSLSGSMTVEKKKTSYLREVQNELKKVSWTSKSELLFCTKAVILATLFFGLAIYGIDLVIRMGLGGVERLLRLVLG